MHSQLLRLFAVVALTITVGCGEGLADPTITLPEEANLERYGSTWHFTLPFRTTATSGATDVEYSFRVRELRGGFLNDQSKAVSFKTPPSKVLIPLNARPQFPTGVVVELQLEVTAISWNGVDSGIAVKTESYNFSAR